ncbi:MAG: ASKHA domain-containing protein [Victivallaceae bacterium]|nr:ASKHA domain-containing protein [Victivallaceae bacterium]
MPKVKFSPSGTSVTAQPGTALLDCARDAGVEIVAPCGGKGTCGKCIVRITTGDVDSDSLGKLSRADIADGYVLACKTKLATDDIVVEVPERDERQGGKFTEAAEDSSLVRQELFPKNWQFDPLAIKWCVQVAEPQMEDGMSDIDRLTRALQKEWGRVEFTYPLSVVREVAAAVRDQDGMVTVTMIMAPGNYHVIGIEAGSRADKHYGIAIDIGTTTVAVQIVYLPTAEPVAAVTDYNDQVTCGLDVISRINYAAKPERLEELRERVLKTINKLIHQSTARLGIELGEICNAVVSGNTTMMHLLLGLNPEYIRLDPYTPTVLKTPYLTASEVGLDINPQSWVYISPCVGSYVGGDITAGILCTDLATDSEEINLFIDIGTNGEIVIGNRDFLMTCACSAGPAFEGGGIKYGMRATLGAIEKIDIDPESGRAEYQTVGGVKPKGICGSGIIALTAKLLLTGWLNAAGKLNREKASDLIKISGRQASYTIVPAADSEHGEDISISEIDFENIIRTKAAIYSACSLMLSQLELAFDDLSNIYIAGGFGRFLDLEMAITIGLIPDQPREKYKYIGNSSLTGTFMVLVSQEYRERQLEVAERMTYIDLGTDPAYMDQYTSAMFMPHTDMNLFPTVKAKLAQ